MYLGMDQEELQKLFDNFMDDYRFLKGFIEANCGHDFKNWKAGGFLIDHNVVSMYKTMEQAFDSAVANMPVDDEDEEFED